MMFRTTVSLYREMRPVATARSDSVGLECRQLAILSIPNRESLHATPVFFIQNIEWIN
jgi:hypothetical protein